MTYLPAADRYERMTYAHTGRSGLQLPKISFGLIKTAGGLFDHLAGKTRRAPTLVQRLGFEWLWRLLMEPRRLFWRYLTTNPRALVAILRNSR